MSDYIKEFIEKTELEAAEHNLIVGIKKECKDLINLGLPKENIRMLLISCFAACLSKDKFAANYRKIRGICDAIAEECEDD